MSKDPTKHMNKNTKCKGGNLHLIKIPKRYIRSVERSALGAFKEVRVLFKYEKPVEIVVFSSIPGMVIPELGIIGHALGQGDIVIDIDFQRKDVAKIIQKELPNSLFHEFSHIVRGTITKIPGTTLLEDFIIEGIGSYIEKHICKNVPPYIKPIKNEELLFKKAKRAFQKKSYTWRDHVVWFYGQGTLPRWIGYRLGYLIVSGYMKNNKNTSMADLTRMKASEIFKKSGY